MGTIKKTSLEAYSRPRTNGINAINVREGDELIEALLTSGSDEILIATQSGRAIRFNEDQVRPMGRTATGVRGVRFDEGKNDCAVGMICIKEPNLETILVVSENGYGKRSFLNDPEDGEPVYRITNRGGKGVKTISITDKTGPLLSIKSVTNDHDLMIITKQGIVIRMHMDTIRVMGRAAQGVRLINLKGNKSIAAIARVPRSDEEDDFNDEENEELDNGTTIEDNGEE